MEKNPNLLRILIIFIIVVAVVWFALLRPAKITRDPENQLAALRAGDLKKAYSYGAKPFQDATSFEQFKAFVDQYPVLKDYTRVTFAKKTEKDEEGRTVVSGTLIMKDGDEIPIRYRLVKENNRWKIFALNVSALGQKPLPTDRTNPNLPNYLFEKDNLYSISYPKDWVVSRPEKGTLVITAPDKGDAALYSTVNIQSVLASGAGGQYDNIAAFIDNFKTQAKALQNFKILEEGDLEHHGMAGKYMLVTYKYNNIKVRQLQYVFMRKDGTVFYAFAYTSPEVNFDKYADLAKQMLATFDVRN